MYTGVGGACWQQQKQHQRMRLRGGLMIYGERRRLPVDLFLFLMAKTGNRGGVRASKM